MRSASHLHLYLLVASMCTTRVLWLRYVRTFLEFWQYEGGSAQAISTHGKVLHLLNTFFFALPWHVTIMDRHLHGITRYGLLPKVHTLDGASGPFAVVKRTMVVVTAAMEWEESTPK